MKKTGKIQLIFKPGVYQGAKERNETYSFAGWFDLLKKIYRAYKSGCYKCYVFFDESNNNKP